jgi:fatty-acyl-CoA synthase
MTADDLLRERADRDAVALCLGDETWTYRQLAEEASRRAALFDDARDHDHPPHIGVLLDNVADYVFWLGAAALSGSVVVGINSSYRG